MRRRQLYLLGGVILVTVLAIIFVSGSMSPLAWGDPPGQQDERVSPQVFDSNPLPGEEIAVDAALTFYFSEAMDAASVEAVFSVEPEIAGALDWLDDATLRFKADEPFDRAATYTVTIGVEAISAEGVPLDESFALRVQTVGFLEVSEVLPSPDATAIEDNSTITVIFNRPVVPLVTIEDMADLPHPLVIEPEVAGAGEWLNTAVYIFRPAGLDGGTTYTVTIAAGLTDVTGGVLSEDFTWSFETLPPMVLSVNPSHNSSDLPLDSEVNVSFNQPMDTASVEEAFILVEQSDGIVSGTFEWSDDDADFAFVPDENLRLGGFFTARIDAEIAVGANGVTQLDEPVNWNFTTVGMPGIARTEPFRGQGDASPNRGFTIFFDTPMDADSLEGKVSIEPEPERDYENYYYSYNNRYRLAATFDPETTYTATIEPGMADVYGNTIDEGLVVTFTTAAYAPDISLTVPGRIGMYSAYAPLTRVFATHRNISQLDLSLYQVSLERLAAVTGPDGYQAWDAYWPRTPDLLRHWSLPVEQMRNRYRYELLNLSTEGASTGDVECIGALEPRLEVGGQAIVITDPDPLRARSALPDGEIVELLYRDYLMPVVGGPVCAGNLYWWQVELRDGSQAWIAEGAEDEYWVELETPAPEAAVPTTVATASSVGSDESLPPGVYFLQMSSPETAAADRNPLKHMMVVSTANIMFKYSNDSALIWVTDLESGLPVPDAPVTIYDETFRAIASGTTDADGVLNVDVPRMEDLYEYLYAVVNDEDAFGFAVNNWTSGIEPYNFEQSSNFHPQDQTIYLYTDRPLYRPDQPVYFRGVARARDDVTYTLPGDDTVRVRIQDPNGEWIYDENLPLTPYGTFSSEFNLSDDAALGYYRLTAIQGVGQPEEDYYGGRDFSISFGVAEYRAPEFQVIVTPEVGQVVQGDTIRVNVESSFFFGGPVSNANVSYSVLSQNYFFNYTGEGRYRFVDYNYDAGPGGYYGGAYGGTIAEGEGTTDDQGNFMIEVPADLGELTQSQTYTIEARIVDESDQQVAGRTSVVVHQGELYVGLRPDRYISTAGQEATVNLIAVDWESEGLARQDIDVEVVERRWSSVQEEDEYGRTVWTWEVEEIPVEGAEDTVISGEDGMATFTYTPPTAGTYKVYASTRDDLGNVVLSSTFMWVSGREYVSWRQQNSNRIDLITNQDDYTVGDTAEILIASPFQGEAWALVTVERGDVLSHEVIVLETNSTTYSFEVDDSFAPNAFVSVMIVKGVDENNPVAAFRMGLTRIDVDPERREIIVTVTPDREQAGPRESVIYTVETTNYAGEPIQAEVGFGLTDLAVLSIADPNSIPLMDHFYGRQGLSIRTAMPLTLSVDQLTQTTLDTVKGGGGGFGEGGIFDIRQEFVDTPFWSPSVVTGEDGTATVEVMLPDNLTTWRMDARAVTSGEDGLTLVGQTEFDLISTKPLLMRPLTPRFFVVGDALTLAAVVNNNTGEMMTVDASLQATGVTFNSPQDITAEIPTGQRHRFEWMVTVEEVENVDLTFFANGNDGAYTDASKPPLGQGEDRLLPVYRYEVPETVGTGGMIDEAGTRIEAIALPRRYDVTEGELTVRIDPSLAATTIDGLDWLRNYPHQCVEQTVSRFLPNIMTYRALESLDVANEELRENLEEAVSFALQKLYAEQKVDGGWGWFLSDESSPLTTAYALIGLVEAQDSGFDISGEVIARAVNYLNGQLLVVNESTRTWVLNRQSFLLYALAHADRGNVARTVQLFAVRERLSLYARAYLALALNDMVIEMDAETDALVSDLVSRALLSATGAHWEEDYHDRWNWNTNTRTTAIVLGALIELDPENDLLAQAVRWLMVARTADHWETTQETAWAVMALTDWMVLTGELQPDYTMLASLNGERLFEEQATPDNIRESFELRIEVADLLTEEVNRLALSHGEGDGVMYYTAHLRAFLPVPEVEAVSRGIIIDRRYSLVDDPDRTPIDSAPVGANVRVTLTIIAPNNLHYVVIEDPIPAGADAVDPGLRTSSIVGTRPEVDLIDPLSRGWGWWYFSHTEFRDEKAVIYATYLPAGTYEYSYVIRTGLSGEYNVIPTTGQEFYFPEVYGRSNGMLFTITADEE